MNVNLALTYLLTHNDPDKHLASTPEQVQRLMFFLQVRARLADERRDRARV